ncbi:MAG: hypothetical protein VKJ64_01800 [Leptolyngbyaceae bacterium]|nr:hypothetical protein [Leptolyngbyaceae bacterium]
MSQKPEENTYLQQVLQEKAEADRKLSRRPHTRSALPNAAPMMATMAPPLPGKPSVSSDTPPAHGGKAVDYRITGFGIWKSLIVPPNLYTVHTRRGHQEPLHIGMGISFRFNPLTDSFLVIPASVQTILINANCICLERQGLLVQAYVQWVIDDIRTAYWKLDFSDPEDPMGIVNLQLREQAEAAIKDKVATLSIDEVLSDKQPIIEELTHRLRTVAEGTSNGDTEGVSRPEGLGLKIVTVQIKEAVVSSTQLWENLQAPFRAERQKMARLAQLESEQQIKARELENQLSSERGELGVQGEIEQLRSQQARITYDREQAEKLRRNQLEQEAERQVIGERSRTEQARNQAQLEIMLQKLDLERQQITAEMEKVQQQLQLDAIQAQKDRAEAIAQLDIQGLRDQADVEQRDRLLDLDQKQRAIDNDISEAKIQAQLVGELAAIAQHLPAPQEQRTTIITSDPQDGLINPLLTFLASLKNLTHNVLSDPTPQPAQPAPNPEPD